MKKKTKFVELKSRLAEINDLENAFAVLSWDQQTYMPPGGAPARSEQLATLRKTAHEWFTSDETGTLLEAAAQETAGLAYESDEASLVRVAQRDYQKARKVPSKLVAELARVTAMATDVWNQARKQSNFALFQPHLQRIVELQIELAQALGYTDRIYDPLLDQFEPGMKTAQVEETFAEIKPHLVRLAREIGECKDLVDDSILHGLYDEQGQWDFGIEVIKRFGFDFMRGRQDRSPHPFTTGFSPNDVRITTRFEKDLLASALFSTLHECGYALYHLGLSPSLERTPLADGASYGIHESQSRLWENLVGRSRGFWEFFFPRLKATFTRQLAHVDVEAFYQAINRVEPSLIRVEADEVTYNLHIMLRFDLEKALLEGKLKVADLPEAWDAKMEEYLGLTPPNDAQGVLQDIHWSGGSFGYFPTYALGNLISVQFWGQALKELPDLPSQIEAGQFHALRAWLREKIHQHGRKFTPVELIQRVTGSGLQAEPYLTYIRSKFSDIYQF
jgi:carboxypeptidase Taq